MEFRQLTAEQRHQFYAQGYLIVREALDRATVERLISVGDRLIASDITRGRDFTGNQRFDGFRNIIALDDAFLPLLTCPSTVPLIVQLFGPNIQLQTSHLIYTRPDPPDTPHRLRLPEWHRDIYGTAEDIGHAQMPRVSMKCAYYLSDVSEPFSGMTKFAPGSNHLKATLEIDPSTGDPANVVEPRLKPGDAVFFENRTWHAAGPNLTGRTRKVLFYGYCFRWVKPMDYRSQPHELLDKVSGIGKQLLDGIADPQGRYFNALGGSPLREWCEAHGVQRHAVA